MTVIAIPLNLPNPIFTLKDEVVVDARPMDGAKHALQGQTGSVFGFGHTPNLISVLFDGGGVHTLGAGDIKHRDPRLTARRLVALFNRLRGHTTLLLTSDLRVNRPDQLPADPILDPRIRKMVAESLVA
ncbi:MAG: hypothetical protein ACK4SL_03365 [Candidatus Paceibacteria bacterium]